MRKKTEFDDLDKKEHPLKMLYPAAKVIYDFFEKRGKADTLFGTETAGMLAKQEDPRRYAKLCGYKTISFILLTLFCTVMIGAVCLFTQEDPLLGGNTLKRPETGAGEISYELTVNSDVFEKEEAVDITVSEKKCPDDRLDEYFDEAIERLKKAVIKGNPSTDEITENIEFVDAIPGTPIKVKFDDPDFKYIYSDGTIRFENIEKPEIVMMTAELVYFDETRYVSFPIRIIPVEKKEDELLREKIALEIEKADEGSSGDDYLELPENIDGTELDWKTRKGKTAGIIIMLGIIAAFGLIPAMSAELKKQCAQREQEMLKDYPDIISKLSLLLTAGMTCRAAWEKICTDYVKGKENLKKAPYRYAYEEMLRALNQFNLGKAESEVYEEFANRCRVPAYQRMGSMLSKNLKRGSSEITALLQSEAQNAMEERREKVRQKGEEVGTKLLLPMFGMFGIVIAIVVVPAISSMGF